MKLQALQSGKIVSQEVVTTRLVKLRREFAALKLQPTQRSYADAPAGPTAEQLRHVVFAYLEGQDLSGITLKELRQGIEQFFVPPCG